MICIEKLTKYDCFDYYKTPAVHEQIFFRYCIYKCSAIHFIYCTASCKPVFKTCLVNIYNSTLCCKTCCHLLSWFYLMIYKPTVLYIHVHVYEQSSNEPTAGFYTYMYVHLYVLVGKDWFVSVREGLISFLGDCYQTLWLCTYSVLTYM